MPTSTFSNAASQRLNEQRTQQALSKKSSTRISRRNEARVDQPTTCAHEIRISSVDLRPKGQHQIGVFRKSLRLKRGNVVNSVLKGDGLRLETDGDRDLTHFRKGRWPPVVDCVYLNAAHRLGTVSAVIMEMRLAPNRPASKERQADLLSCSIELVEGISV